ncbi:streptococcal hemagglutinin isoform X3 [Eurosta solidaginis]|uniref:streptococcal hemagglutinin isoform X3 n=1 Tax=Eurosta solidaginis TaxID=178769 RepID=UPI0035314FEF
MDLTLERENSALGSLFQQIINDLKNTSPLWEDFLTKATKLHQCLRAAIQAIAAYLDAFQKIADAATNSRGASKEIGTALTRVCLRHKAVESRLKTFTTAIMDCLVQPLQEKLEDWKRTVITIDKEHAKEYKRCRNELKKRSSDTLRLQKKARKGQSDTIQSLMDTHMQDVTLRRAELEDVEKKSLRSAMIEERLRYCTFVHMLQPVVKEECEVMSELGHLQEAMDSIAIVTKDPSILPQASEELIHDTKATMTLYPESPGGGSGSQGGCSNSLGSRKSSVCSISSMNSSGSSNSPGHHHYQRSLSQLISPAIRLKPGESSDSGFCSSPALTTQASTATSQSHAVSTWPPHCQDAVPVLPPAADRPHTISTAYEKGHQRPPLTVYTFQNPETILEGSGSIPGTPNGASSGANSGANTPSTQQKSLTGSLSRPPLPVRCSSLERPLPANNNRSTNNLLQRQCPSPIPAHITKELTAHHAQQQHIQQQQQQQQHLQQLSSPPTYVNMSELANMAAQKITANPQQQQRPVADLQQQHSIDSISSQFSNDSNASSGHHQTHEHQQQQQTAFADTNSVSKPRSHSVSSSSASSNTPSLHSHPSIESGTVTAPLVGQTPTPSSGSSTPQNHYSPLLTNSPSSTAAGTPSGGSMTSGMMSGFVYNVNSPTPPQSGTTSIDSDVLKITEIAGDHPINMPPTKEINSQLQQQELNNPNNASMGNITNDSQNIPTEITAQITTNTTNNKTFNEFDTESSNIVENDERSRASVLQKASMFEKQAAAAAAPTPIVVTGRSQTDAIYGTRRNAEDLHRATSTPANHYQQPPQQQHEQHSDQQDVDKSFEDSIQELNNLIGELDSFQREIDASKRPTSAGTPTTAANNIDNNYGELPYASTNTGDGSADVVDCKTRATSAQTTTLSESVNSVTSMPLTIICPSRPPKSPQCASNQTSGCGTDISDATSDEIAADIAALSINNENQNISISIRDSCSTENNLNNGRRTLQQYNSDTELSRCYVSETSSLAGGYENPTFAHFATAVSSSSIAASSGVDESSPDVGSVLGDSRSLMAVSSTTGDDSVSHTSDTNHQQQQWDHDSDCGSNVVVIYDHQIPITPDIDYVKQNSEIVVLRTKDPLQQKMARQEMRELTQLPVSICMSLDVGHAPGVALSSSSLSCSVPTSPPHTATVAPAKQRLSSFRASSEQQLQLIGCRESMNSSGSELSLSRTPHQYAAAYSGTQNAQEENKGGNRKVVERPSAYNNSDTIICRKAVLPPKPSLSIFNGQMAAINLLEANISAACKIKSKSSSNNNSGNSCEAVAERLLGAAPAPPPPLKTKANFKADLDAKIRKQKLKLQLQHEQQQHQQLMQQKQKLLVEQQQLQQQHSPQSVASNTTNTPPIYLSNHNHSNNNNSNSKNTNITNTTNTTSTPNGSRNNSSASSSNTNNSSSNNNCNAITLTKRNGSAHIPNLIATKIMNATASASSYASPSNHMVSAVKAASSSAPSHPNASSASAQLVYQNGTKYSSNSNCSNKIASTSYPKISKQTHSNRNYYQFHALKSPNNNHINAQSSRPKRSASMSSKHPTINPILAPPSPTPSTLTSLSLSFRTPSSSRSSNGQNQCQTTQPPQQRLHLDTVMSGVAQNHKQKQNHDHNTVSSSLIPSSSVSVTSSTSTYESALPPTHTSQSQSAASATVSTTTSTSKSNMNFSIAKPNVTPRPASLSGGVTRIARRSSVNTAKPPPPVRRSSSVTPSHNATSTGTSPTPQQNQYQQTQDQIHQQPSHNSQYDMVDTLPPPPAYLLDSRPSQSTPTPPPPSAIAGMAMPNSSLKVAETVKALSAMRHKPASPNSIRHMQQQQQYNQLHNQQQLQLQQHTTLQPTKPQLLQQQHATQQLQDAHGNKGNSLRTTPIKGVGQQTVSPSYTSPPPYDFQHNKIELPPPLPPPNPNQQRSRKQQQQQQVAADHQHTTTQITTTQITTTQQYDSQQQNRQYEELYDYLPSQQHLPASLKQQYKHQEQQQQQQQHLNLINDALTDHENEPPISYSDNGSFRTSSPGIYAQPKIVTSMSSFRSASPAANEHHNQHHHVIPPTQPKTNPNLIAQLSARLNKQNQQQQQHNSTSEGTYGSTPNSPNHHNHQHHQSEPEKFRNYTHPHQQQHQQQQQQQTSATNALAQQQQNYDAAQPSKHQQTGVAARHCITPTQSQQQQHHRELHHSCPPPLENPPPPPNSTTTVYAVTANAGSTTMPKNVSRGGGGNAATYAPPSGTMTLPKNLAQQRLQQQQHYQQQQQQQQQHFQQQQQHYQQQQYHHPTVTGANSGGQQHSQTASGNQRSQMPLPHHHQQQQQQMTYKQKSATLQSNHRQPPVPTRHSSVQQKIFVATNPFIQTTAIHCHSPASVQSQPASPTCSSPSSLASIYGTSSRHHHHHQQQQQQQQHQISAGSYGNGGGSGGNGGGHGYYAAPHNSTSYASSNIEKAGSIRSKTKAEFLENLNAKLAKQGLSGRAFAVRNLINSKALPDPRICHESLMDQIKRGATLKRNQKINDRSAPKIL